MGRDKQYLNGIICRKTNISYSEIAKQYIGRVVYNAQDCIIPLDTSKKYLYKGYIKLKGRRYHVDAICYVPEIKLDADTERYDCLVVIDEIILLRNPDR